MRHQFEIDDYLAEINRYELLTLEDETALAERIRQGDKEAVETLKNANLRSVVSLVRQYMKEDVSPEVLLHSGNMALEEATEMFAKEMPSEPFITFAEPHVRKALEGCVARYKELLQNQLDSFMQRAKQREAEARKDPVVDRQYREREELYSRMYAKHQELRERFMQGDLSVLDDALSTLEREEDRLILKSYYGFGASKKNLTQIAELLGVHAFGASKKLLDAKRNLGVFYCGLLDMYAQQHDNCTPKNTL